MRVASLRLRFLAGVVDAVVVIGGMAAAVGISIAGVVIYARVRGGDDQHDGGEQDGHSHTRSGTQRVGQSPELRAAVWGASAGLDVAGRNLRGPGFRAIGLRRVDAQQGGSVSVRSAVIGVLFDKAWEAATAPLYNSRAQRARDRMTALGPQLRAVERKYPDDSRARARAVQELYRANNVEPFAGCGRQLVAPVVSRLILSLPSREGRTVRDRITGTSVIVDR